MEDIMFSDIDLSKEIKSVSATETSYDYFKWNVRLMVFGIVYWIQGIVDVRIWFLLIVVIRKIMLNGL